MDNYRLLSPLGHGALGSVFKVEDKRNDKQYVLKKIECCNETSANKVFKEALCLESLQHSHVCRYHEFFVAWDEIDFAVYMCIVMEYYPQGDLEHYLSGQRSLQQAVDEKMIRMWVGQLVEALAYVHNKQMTHRNLKSTNAFLNDDLSLSLGDFGIASAISEARVLTRPALGRQCWLAPELQKNSSSTSYDQQSDVWSLGCILLDMTTCSFLTEPEFKSNLYLVKVSTDTLDGIIEKVSMRYSQELASFLRLLLRINHHQRPTAMDLLENSFILDCLAVYDSPLLQQLTAAKDPQDEIIVHMKRAGGSVEAQLKCLKKLQELMATEGHPLSPAMLHEVELAMTTHSANPELQSLALHLLYQVVFDGKVELELLTTNIINLTCSAMKKHSSHYDTQLTASSLLMVLSATQGLTTKTLEPTMIQQMMKSLRLYPDQTDLITNHCITIASSASDVDLLVEEGAVQVVCRAIRDHMNYKTLMDAGCSALWSLSLSDKAIVLLIEENATKLLYLLLRKFTEEPTIVKFSCATLANLAEYQGECAYAVFGSVGDEDGLVGLLAAMKMHCSNNEVIPHALYLLQQLLMHDDILEELQTRGLTEFIRDLQSSSEETQQMLSSIADLFINKDHS